MDLVIDKAAVKALCKIQPKLAASIMKKAETIAADPMAKHTNVEVMQGIKNGFRIRQRDWRVIYEIDTNRNVMRITKIGPRGQVYR